MYIDINEHKKECKSKTKKASRLYTKVKGVMMGIGWFCKGCGAYHIVKEEKAFVTKLVMNEIGSS